MMMMMMMMMAIKKDKASSLDIAPLTILNSGTLQPRKWQLTGNDYSTAAHMMAYDGSHFPMFRVMCCSQ